MTDRTSRAVAPVSAICAAFRTQPSAYPPEATKPDVAPVCGSFTGTAGTEGNRLQAACGGGRSRKRQGRRKPWRFFAPGYPLLPAVRAVLRGENGAFLRVRKVV